MAEAGLQPHALTTQAIDQFLALRRAQGANRWISTAALAPLMSYLRRIAAAPEPLASAPVMTELDGLLDEYRTYLATERALAARSIRAYVAAARLFLSKRSGATLLSLVDLTAVDVAAFVLQEVRARRTGSAKWVVKGTRAFLRFLHVEGRISKPLVEAVPAVASWRLSTLPKALEPSQVNRLLASCDQTSSVGLRDFAILTVLVRLGLRCGELAALKLSDVDWRQGELVIHGKAGRQERLPLPVDVGRAIVSWLQNGRPVQRGNPYVFARVRAPHGGLTASGVSNVVRAACIRAGLPPIGGHRLRHTAATQMLRSGADLTEIGQVLRHHSLLATAIYAKVDRACLASLARPWPGDAA
jgi:site-specific recombinase XerD